jgi:hypothetical protein
MGTDVRQLCAARGADVLCVCVCVCVCTHGCVGVGVNQIQPSVRIPTLPSLPHMTRMGVD